MLHRRKNADFHYNLYENVHKSNDAAKTGINMLSLAFGVIENPQNICHHFSHHVEFTPSHFLWKPLNWEPKNHVMQERSLSLHVVRLTRQSQLVWPSLRESCVLVFPGEPSRKRCRLCWQYRCKIMEGVCNTFLTASGHLIL